MFRVTTLEELLVSFLILSNGNRRCPSPPPAKPTKAAEAQLLRRPHKSPAFDSDRPKLTLTLHEAQVKSMQLCNTVYVVKSNTLKTTKSVWD